MRGSAWLLPIAALLLCLAAVLWPAVAAVEVLLHAREADRPSYVPVQPLWELIVLTGRYAAAVASFAVLLGWVPGHLLGRALQRGHGFTPLAILLLVPICVPAYVVFYAWWQAWPPGSVVHGWAVEHDAVRDLTRATLVLALSCWSWPLVSWCVAAATAQRPTEQDELLRLDGASSLRRLAFLFRSDAPMLAAGWLLVLLATFNNTTSFDLANIFTYGNELRAMDAAGATPAMVLRSAGPPILLVAVGALIIWWILAERPFQVLRRTTGSSRWGWAFATTLWILSVIIPMGLFAANALSMRRIEEFFTLYGRSLGDTVATAAMSGLLAVAIAGGLTWCWIDHRRWVRWTATAMAVAWLIAALVPSTIVSIGLETAWNLPVSAIDAAGNRDGQLAAGSRELKSRVADVIYRTPIILMLGHLARFGFVAALLARWASAGEPAGLRDLRRIDGVGTARSLTAALWPRLLAAGVATFAIVGVLAMGEIAVTARLYPATASPLAVSLLNDMHYQRPESVLVAVIMMTAAAGLAASVAIAVWAFMSRRFGAGSSLPDGRGSLMSLPHGHGAAVRGDGRSRRRRGPSGHGPSGADRGSLALLLSVTAALWVSVAGCSPREPGEARPLETQHSFGSPGRFLGQFNYPRCIDVDEQREVVYVIDKTARVQRFSVSGKPQHQWRMPEMDNGKPTGVSVAPDGRVFIADTHYHRIIACDRDGRELMRFGSYGEGPGQFIYPTDIAFGPEGRLYVSEYGGNDRIQVFSAAGEYLFEFGSFGEGPAQFTRPQSIVFNRDRTELFIADACNHRIVVVDPRGRELRHFGEAGTELGKLHYPYGLALEADGTLLVAEFGNNRIQRFTPRGAPLGVFGTYGARAGELRYPWGIAATADGVFVLDSGNDRVQMVEEL